mgnify:CR=1 FL=1
MSFGTRRTAKTNWSANGAVEVDGVGGTSGASAAGSAGSGGPDGRDVLLGLLGNHVVVGGAGDSLGTGAAPNTKFLHHSAS